MSDEESAYASEARRRVPSKSFFFRTNRQYGGAVHLEGSDGGSACGCQPDDTNALPAKMLGPSLTPRVENRRIPACLRILRHFSRRLVERARNAGQSEVVFLRLSARHHRGHVIDVKRGSLSDL
jgi:hypothetical protein